MSSHPDESPQGIQLSKEPVPEELPEPRGINLVLVYTLLALALAAAIFFALFVVRPFYIRR